MKQVLATLLLFAGIAWAQPGAPAGLASPASGTGLKLPATLQGIGIKQTLNATIPLDIEFQNETGATLPLRSYFGAKPVLLIPVYYTCPMLCDRILDGVVAGLRPLSIQPGRDFEVVAFSINPKDTPVDAAAKRAHYSHSYSSKAGVEGWNFLTGPQASITALTNAIGFHYRWDPKTQMFIHASGVMVITPEGRIARYLYGVEYQPKDLKLSLVEASHEKIGSPADQVLLFCYHYDPSTGKYGLVVMDLLRLAGIFAVVAGAMALIFLWKRDLHQHREAARALHPRMPEASHL